MIKEEDYLKAKQIIQEYEKQLNISDVSKRFNQKIDERITKLQSDWNEYTKPKRFEPMYTPEGHEYHKSIPIRLDELKWILKNVY